MKLHQIDYTSLGKRKWAEEKRSSKAYLFFTVLVVFSALYALTFIFTFTFVLGFASAWLILLMLLYFPASIALTVAGIIANKPSKSNFVQFAQSNGWEYKFSEYYNTPEEVNQLKGAHGTDAKYVSVFGNIDEIGNFEFLIGGAYAKKRSKIIVQEPELLFETEREVPSCILVSKHYTSKGSMLDSFVHQFKNPKKVSLEGDFDEHFQLYIEENTAHIEVLSTIAPDLMQIAKDYSWRFNIKFYGKKVALQLALNSISKEDTYNLFRAAAALRRVLDKQGW